MTREIYAPVSVIEPVGRAIEEVKNILFRPFNLEKWFTVGLCAWLAFLGGSGGVVNVPNFQDAGKSASQESEHIKEWVVANLNWIIPLGIVLVIAFFIIGIVLSWLKSRGQFMFLHCVAKNKAEVSIPWAKYRSQGNSLFLFRLCFGLISFVLIALYTLVIVVCLGIMANGSHGSDEAKLVMILAAIAGGLGFVLLVILLVVILKFTQDFVVPIMYLRSTTCMAAWSEFMEIWSARKGALFVYILFQFVIFIALGALTTAVFLITCCCACCITMIPYIGTVFLLPILVFKRAYSLHYLRQFGSDFDVFLPEPEVEPAPVIVM